MKEITHILYAKVQERCQQSVLRLHNQTFLHAIACEEIIGKPKILTDRRFYGQYMHSLVCHAPIQHRIIALRSTNTEQQERHFSTFLSVSLATSSRRPGESITPGMIRMQAEMKQGERNAIQEQESQLGRLSKCLPKAENSIIPHRILLKYPYAYQAHLERISDFLLCGEGAWWRHTVSGIEFFDVNTPDEDSRGAETLPPLHHFHSHTLKSESTYLQDEWKKCLSSAAAVKIPHQAIRVFDERGNLDHIINTGFLQDDDDDDDDDDSHNDKHDHVEQGSKNYAEDGSQLDYDEDSDEEEENIVAVEELGECLLDQDDQQLELEKNDTETTEATNTGTAVAQKANYEINLRHNEQCPATSLSSSLAKNIAKVMGETEDVKLLDRLRNKLRNNSSSINLQEDYKKQLAHVQTKVLGKHSQVAKSFKEWEKLFTSMNNYIEPSLDDIQKDEKGYISYRTLRLCRQLLQHWNITVHL